MSDLTPRIEMLPGHGGTSIAVHRLGRGGPVVLLHGLASSADTNWIRYGHAAALSAAHVSAPPALPMAPESVSAGKVADMMAVDDAEKKKRKKKGNEDDGVPTD